MPTYDDNYTKDAKPTASHTITAKPTASPTITAKPTGTYDVTEKPYTEPLAILTEASAKILYESGITMSVEGAF